MRYQFRRDRSDFWIIVHDNEDSYNISTNSKYITIINFFFPLLEIYSLTKWKVSETHSQMSSLWIPKGRCRQELMEEFMNWCDEITQDVIWLNLNKNIEKYFIEELDFCIASDFNFIYGNGRTEIGEAEYQLKYNFGNLTTEAADDYFNLLFGKMMDNCKYIPIGNKNNWYISPMPALESGKEKIAWLLADEMAYQMDISFINAELKCDKPQMKQLSIADKIATWQKIYYNGMVKIDRDVKGKNVLIIDDLYQSGTTMWQYARFLKEKGARRVFGMVCVKSLKDSDNT